MTAADFFRDTPWLNVPNERRGNIMGQSRYPRGGLLGGSGETAKPSKLAALAAARKKAQEDKKKALLEASGNKEPSTSVSLLEKLSIRPKNEGIAKSAQSGTSDDLKRKLSTSSSREVPPRLLSRQKPQEGSVADIAVDLQAKVHEKEPFAAVPDLRAIPSSFARTMLGPARNSPPVTEDNMITLPYPRLAAPTDRNPFAGPSPDDVVLNAQAKGSK